MEMLHYMGSQLSQRLTAEDLAITETSRQLHNVSKNAQQQLRHL